MSTGSVSSVSTSCCLDNYAAKSSYVIEVDDAYVLNVVQERIHPSDGQGYSVSVTVNPVCKAPGEKVMSRRSVDEVIRNYLEANLGEDVRTNQPKSKGTRSFLRKSFLRVMLPRKDSAGSLSTSCSSRENSFGSDKAEPLKVEDQCRSRINNPYSWE
eukprot:7251185-Pyramimonas_sp.AAC.1